MEVRTLGIGLNPVLTTIYYLTLNNKTYECSIKAFENSEQYYNETFNTKEK